MQRNLRTVTTVIAASVLVIGGLSACSQGPASSETESGCSSTLAPGVLTNNVRVSGDAGEMPSVTMPTGASILTNQRTLLPADDIDADERAEHIVTGNALIGANLSMFDSGSGEQLYASPAYSDETAGSEYFLYSPEAEGDPLSSSLACTIPGDRVVLGLDQESSLALAQQLGGSITGSLVVVMDIESVTSTSSTGVARGLPSGFPAVVTNDEGQPGVVMPPTESPEGMNVATRIAGSGETVRADSNVIANVLVVDRSTGAVTQNTWESGITAIGSEADIAQSGFTFRTGVTGAKVGSQLVILENADDVDQVVVIDIIAVM